MKFRVLAFCLFCAAVPAVAEARVNLSGVIGKDFMSSPSFDQAVRALGSDSPFGGFGWEVIIDHIGLGGQYLVDFHSDDPHRWWLDWDGQAIYTSYHLFGARSVVDPFVDTGIGCAGRVFLGAEDCDAARLAISIYPFVSAGAAVNLHHLRIAAKLSYALGESAIPATAIPGYPIGRFQVSALVGFTLGSCRPW
jgi:hypothetical protein